MSSTQLWESEHGRLGSRDGQGAGDHDQPYRFGWRPRASVPYPFNTRQFARLLVLRGRVQDIQTASHRQMFNVTVLARIALARHAIDAMQRRHFGRVVLVHSVRYAAELTYRDEIAGIGRAHSGAFAYIPMVSREPTPDALAGRIPAAIEWQMFSGLV